MKTSLVNRPLLVIGMILIGSLAISFKGTEKKTLSSGSAPTIQQDLGQPPTRKAKLTFKKDKVYQILFYTMNEDNQKRLFEGFFPTASKIWERHGRKYIGTFNIVESRSKNLQSSDIAIFEWPDFETYQKVESDQEFKKAAVYRNGGFSYFKNGWFSTDKDITVEIREDKVYEFAGATLVPTDEAKKTLAKYFEISEPIKRNYGGSYPKFVAEMSPIDSKGNATYNNEMQLIVEWDSVEDNKKLFANKEFKTKAAPLMQKALLNADFVFTKFVFR